jgi:hypothetical protein
MRFLEVLGLIVFIIVAFQILAIFAIIVFGLVIPKIIAEFRAAGYDVPEEIPRSLDISAVFKDPVVYLISTIIMLILMIWIAGVLREREF